MAYLPKSKYSIKNTPGDELVYKSDPNRFYLGDYILTSKGTYYAGTNSIKLGKELLFRPELSVEDTEKIEIIDVEVTKHKILRKGIAKFLEEVIPIPYEKPTPTDKDYERGFFKRYFVKRINGEIYKEISEEVYDDLINKKPKYDYNLFEKGNILWHLTGNVFLKNTTSIKKTQKQFKSINFYFTLLDEYKLEENLLQTHLYTSGGELYLPNGKDYIGEYHIHESGPMVGPLHTEEPHEKLYYVNKLPIPKDSTYEDFLKDNLAKGKAFHNKSKPNLKPNLKSNLKSKIKPKKKSQVKIKPNIKKINRTIKKNILNKPRVTTKKRGY